MTFLGRAGTPLAALPQFSAIAEAAPAERRWTVQLYKAWDAARTGNALPCMSDFDLGVIEAFGPDCFLLEIERGTGIARFRYFGRALAAQIGRDLTGQAIASLPGRSLLAQMAGRYSDAVARRRPIGLDGLFDLDGDEHLAYRCVLLPFAADGRCVDAVLGCVRYRRQEGRAVPPPRVKAPAVPAVCDGGALLEGEIFPPEELRKTLAHARKCVVVAAVQQPRRKMGERLGKAYRQMVRRCLWPENLLRRARIAPAIGRAVLAEPPPGAFAVLIARRADQESRRYEVIATADSLVVTLALRWVARKSRGRFGDAPGSGIVAADRLRASPHA